MLIFFRILYIILLYTDDELEILLTL